MCRADLRPLLKRPPRACSLPRFLVINFCESGRLALITCAVDLGVSSVRDHAELKSN